MFLWVSVCVSVGFCGFLGLLCSCFRGKKKNFCFGWLDLVAGEVLMSIGDFSKQVPRGL